LTPDPRHGDPPALVVLAGGRSRRLGRDKRLLAAGGPSLLERTLGVASATGLAVWLAVDAVGSLHRPHTPGVAVLHDPAPGEGPLHVLRTTLDRLGRDLVLLAADLPELTEARLGDLLAEATRTPQTAVVPHHAEGWEPLCAYYPRRLGPAVRAAVEAGERGLTAFLRTRPRAEVRIWEVGATGFRNLNTPDHVAAWRSR